MTFKVTSLDHIVLNVSDVDRSLAFYVDGLGLEPVRLGEYRRGDVKFPSVRVDAGTIIDLFSPEMRSGDAPPNAANLNHFCLVVEGGIDEILARARAILDDLEKGAALPGGANASLRGRTRGGRPQLDLFAGSGSNGAAGSTRDDPPPEPAALKILRNVDLDRLTPLEALALLATLKQSLSDKPSST